MFNKKTILIISLLFLCVFISADFALADKELEIDYPSVIGTEIIDETTNLPSFIKYIFNFIISIGGILAFGILIYSAIRLFLSAGNPQEISEAKSQIMSAVMGLFILFGSYTILTIINPNLRILHISELNPFEKTESNLHEYKDPDTEYYQEIPIGFLTENLLAKNINCFDKNNNLVNCYSKEIILKYEEVIGTDKIESRINKFNPENPDEPHLRFNDNFDIYGEYANFCYDYDIDGINGKAPTGDMIDRMNDDKLITIDDLLTDHDRLDCIQKLSQAIQIKSQAIKDKSDQLKIEIAKCNCPRCEKGRCSCSSNHCHCCGSSRHINPLSCFGNNSSFDLPDDPCPTRNDYAYFGDALEITCDYYYIDDKIMCKGIDTLRIEIYQIMFGDAKTINLKVKLKTMGATFLTDNVDSDGNSKSDPLFLDLREARARMIGLKQELQRDLDYLQGNDELKLKGAEEFAEFSPYGQRISLAEYEQKKSNEKIDKNELKYKNIKNKTFNISEYCKNFYCIPEIELILLEGTKTIYVYSNGVEFTCSLDPDTPSYYICSSTNVTLKECVKKSKEEPTDADIMICPTFLNGVCYMYDLNNLGKLCDTYNLDGDGATLYFPQEKYE